MEAILNSIKSRLRTREQPVGDPQQSHGTWNLKNRQEICSLWDDALCHQNVLLFKFQKIVCRPQTLTVTIQLPLGRLLVAWNELIIVSLFFSLSITAGPQFSLVGITEDPWVQCSPLELMLKDILRHCKCLHGKPDKNLSLTLRSDTFYGHNFK
jgi:hypothetical protein